jgi:hypothetical protein
LTSFEVRGSWQVGTCGCGKWKETVGSWLSKSDSSSPFVLRGCVGGGGLQHSRAIGGKKGPNVGVKKGLERRKKKYRRERGNEALRGMAVEGWEVVYAVFQFPEIYISLD